MNDSNCEGCGATLPRCDEWLEKGGATCCANCAHPQEPEEDFEQAWRVRVMEWDEDAMSERFGKAILGD